MRFSFLMIASHINFVLYIQFFRLFIVSSISIGKLQRVKLNVTIIRCEIMIHGAALHYETAFISPALYRTVLLLSELL